MDYKDEKIINCSKFEELLSDYLDKTLDKQTHKAVAAHALRCPLCHSLLNEVKTALEVCHEISAPRAPLTRLEARILTMTMPETAMPCAEFEEYLTDYLDGFLPAALFHRWERHAVLCENCTNLPGEVVRSIAACYTYKMDELPLPAGLHEKIMQATIGTTEAKAVKASWAAQFGEWIRNLSFPFPMPQFAPVAMILMFAFLLLGETASAENSFSGVYEKSFELAGQTYLQGASIVLGSENVIKQNPGTQEPIQGIYVNQEENKQ
jgi:anti-sigma factor RsiW